MGSHPRDHVTVGIVGGGIAGLALARMLELSGISYCLWEAYREFATHTGASVGLMPNGLRILDQLGMIHKFNEYNVKRGDWEHRDANGVLRTSHNPGAIFEEKIGYGGIFMERQRVLQILYESIEDKTRLHSSKRVVCVVQTGHEAVIVSEDGSELGCDYVAGADGVRSVIRHEIEKATLAKKGPESRESRFDARYACVYGISNPVSGIEPGRSFTVYRPDVSLLIFCGHNGDIYWFMTHDLKRTIAFEKRERFSEQDIEALYTQVADKTVTDGLVFAIMFENRRAAVMTALEEGIAEQFFSGRLFMLGDSAHKMVPQAAMGANLAIESATAFVNILRPFLSHKTSQSSSAYITQSEVELCLEQYDLRRRARVTEAFRRANLTCRAHLKIGPVSEEYWANLPKMMSPVAISKLLDSFSRGEVLENWSVGSTNMAVCTGFGEAKECMSKL